MRSKRTQAVLGMLAGATALSMGTAFACTQTVGKVTISGRTNAIGTVGAVSTPTNSETYESDGGDFGFGGNEGYCGGKPTTRLSMTSTSSTGLPFSLSVTAPNCPRPGTTNYVTAMATGTWDVRWVRAEDGEIDSDFSDPLTPQCHFALGQSFPSAQSAWVSIGSLSVDSSGNGSGNYELAGALRGPGNICLDDGTNKAPPPIPMKWALI